MRQNKCLQIRQLLWRESGRLAVDVVRIVFCEDVHHRGGAAIEHVGGGTPDFAERRRVPFLAFVHRILHAEIVLLAVRHQLIQRMAERATSREIDFFAALRGGGELPFFKIRTFDGNESLAVFVDGLRVFWRADGELDVADA